MSNRNSTRLTALAGICLHDVLDRVTVHTLNDSERMGEMLMDALERRGMTLSHAKFLSLDCTQPLPILLVRQAE